MSVKLSTSVTSAPITPRLQLGQQVCSWGSCFSDAMGNYLREGGYRICINPFGTLYNPLSIADAMERLLDGREFSADELIYHNGLYASLSHHGSFSHPDADETLHAIQTAFRSGREALMQADHLLLTWGTAYIYRLRQSDGTCGMVVANCHKLPEQHFIRSRVSADELFARWQPLISRMLSLRPSLHILTTVSPIRHLRDGAHANQLSKSTLMLFNEQLLEAFPRQIHYFPAYEIVMDELRDYRFYAEDLTHPAAITEKIIAERLEQDWLLHADKAITQSVRNALAQYRHRPLHADTWEDEMRRERLQHILLALRRQYPAVYLPQELNSLITSL